MRIQIIMGTTRPGRFNDIPAKWIFEEAKKRKEIEVELLDLRNYPLPFFNDPISPSRIENGQYANEIARQWAQKIAEGDGYIIVTAEYNHGYPAVLKNALDFIFKEWNGKPVGFVGYGSAGGARAIEQLREVVIELDMIPIRAAVHIPGQIFMALRNKKQRDTSDPFEPLQAKKDALFDELIRLADILKKGRSP